MEAEQMSERQPERDIPGTAHPRVPDDPRPVDPSELSRYDLLLAAIPLVLLCAVLVGHLVTVPLWASLSVGALASVPMVVDGVALHPPT
jgi:hypothetical protein